MVILNKDICAKSVSISFMAKHVNTHISITKTLACEKCQRMFDNKNSLKRHISLLHLDVKPYSCEICQKSYTFEHALKSHKDLHKGQVFPCTQCGKMFKTKAYLL